MLAGGDGALRGKFLMHEGRLFGIIYYLLEKGQATAPELAERFEVSVRTIYRDIDALSAAGIPVYGEAGRSGGFCLMSGFTLDRAVLSEEEKQEILTALRSVDITEGGDGNATLQKLSALFGCDAGEWLVVDFSRWGDIRHDREKFEQLKTAVIQRRAVRITYAGANGNVSERTVWPLRLVYKARAWYLSAFCTKRQEFRMFKLNRILESALLEERFLPRDPVMQEDAAEAGTEPVTLRFPADMAYRVYDEFEAGQVERLENGDLIATAPFPQDAWLTGFLLSFGTKVDILAPAGLRETVAAQAKLLYEKYCGAGAENQA